MVAGDVEGCAQVLESSDDICALSDGLRFDASRREELVRKTESRDTDPDVVIMKGIAKAVLNTNEHNKLARVFVMAVFPEGMLFGSLAVNV